MSSLKNLARKVNVNRLWHEYIGRIWLYSSQLYIRNMAIIREETEPLNTPHHHL